ncbi:MAG: hypothetical protein GC205_03335 [Bacteroidetes bacterium]|nr:hypothetical protein [Bacteroidota bacterium]
MNILVLIGLLLCLSPGAFAQVRNPDGDLREDREPTLQVRERTYDPDTLRPEPSGPVSFWDINRMYAGGSIGASLGTVIFVDLSPMVAYQMTSSFRVGVGSTYRYINNRLPFDEYKANIYGGRVFAQQDLLLGIFAHAEYEFLKAQYIGSDNSTATLNFPSALVGLGYAMPLDGRPASGLNRPGGSSEGILARSMVQLQLLYPISLNPGNSLYFFPVDYRVSVLIGL